MLDLILLYKIIHGLVDIEADALISLTQNRTRGHTLKFNIIKKIYATIVYFGVSMHQH